MEYKTAKKALKQCSHRQNKHKHKPCCLQTHTFGLAMIYGKKNRRSNAGENIGQVNSKHHQRFAGDTHHNSRPSTTNDPDEI